LCQRLRVTVLGAEAGTAERVLLSRSRP
jgi:hypothetical protein